MTDRILHERYQILQQLGKRPGRETLLARDLQSSNLVVVKLLKFSSELEWDDFKLFEREAQTLRNLSHPAIPQYLDYFEFEAPQHKGFGLVQTYLDAKSLETHHQNGRTFSEDEVKEIAEQLLEILSYLHDRYPPIIHRDIKPSNILLGDRSAHSVGRVYLVDFGAVQNVAATQGGTFTVVGTYGYMSPEQFGGRGVPASDLYSLGATLIYLLTGRHPADLPQRNLRIQFETVVSLNPPFQAWLTRAIEPSLERRMSSAREALATLKESKNNRESIGMLKFSEFEIKRKPRIKIGQYIIAKIDRYLDEITRKSLRVSSQVRSQIFSKTDLSLIVNLASTQFNSSTNITETLKNRIFFILGLLVTFLLSILSAILTLFSTAEILALVLLGFLLLGILWVVRDDVISVSIELQEDNTLIIYYFLGFLIYKKKIENSDILAKEKRGSNRIERNFSITILLERDFYIITKLTKDDADILEKELSDWLNLPLQ